MGDVEVPKECLWGAQTMRSLENFKIGTEKMPLGVVRAFAYLKKSAASANNILGLLDNERAGAIAVACDEILAGKWDGEFPLSVWQTGSGTHTNMNVNEVVSHRANQILGTEQQNAVHPNDIVNMGQSSNDTFPTAMHVAAVLEIETRLLPAVDMLAETLKELSARYGGIVKIGRTHLQDATPLTLGQEISGWHEMLVHSTAMVGASIDGLRALAIGGTAVGTGINTHESFGELCAEKISEFTGTRFTSSHNKFHALTSLDAIVFCHGALKAMAANLMKIANDIRWMASGPRSGIGEIVIPENEPGSSIMPGKVNPTQCEAVTMVAVRVMGNDMAIGMAASQGNFELNVFLPVTIDAFLQSARLLADAVVSFNEHCVSGIKPNLDVIQKNLSSSLMLVTALNPHIGYEKAALIAKTAHNNNATLCEAAVSLGLMSPEEFDRIVKPENMTGPLRDKP